MMDIKTLVDNYQKWVRDRTVIRQIKDWAEITTPFLDRHNDHIQIFIKQENNEFLLTDDGYTIDDLEMSGCSLTTPTRQKLLKTTLNGFGIELGSDKSLQIHATENNFPMRKHNLVQAILAVNDLFFTAQTNVINLFTEDVAAWLELVKVRFVPKVKFTGISGFDHLFDFVIPRSSLQPERLIRTINSFNREQAENFAFAWHDTHESRPASSTAYAFINDNEKTITASTIEGLRAYNIKPIMWSTRDKFKQDLSA